jgi:hypothetical protein
MQYKTFVPVQNVRMSSDDDDDDEGLDDDEDEDGGDFVKREGRSKFYDPDSLSQVKAQMCPRHLLESLRITIYI